MRITNNLHPYISKNSQSVSRGCDLVIGSFTLLGLLALYHKRMDPQLKVVFGGVGVATALAVRIAKGRWIAGIVKGQEEKVEQKKQLELQKKAKLGKKKKAEEEYQKVAKDIPEGPCCIKG